MTNSSSFYFYDLETSGFNPRTARIMQFAGQRTDLNLKPIGEPHDIFVKLTEDILPDPGAIMVTGITPQQTIMDGITEVEFLDIFNRQIAQPGTIFVGFNNVRFDDEFIRALNFRNFFDPYKWHWDVGRSRWDLLDLVRITRALRPEGIKWPVNEDGTPTNRLELIAKENGLEHEKAHDALSDVLATINVAKLIRDKQPKLFNFLLSISKKSEILKLVNSGQPFIYTSGKYPNEFQKTTVVAKLADHKNISGTIDGALVYDLRVDPDQFANYSVDQIAEAWRWKEKEDKSIRLPVKSLKLNRCPAIAPLSVITQAENQQETITRLKLDLGVIETNAEKLQQQPGLAEKVLKAKVILDKEFENKYANKDKHVDETIYDGFFGGEDQKLIDKIHHLRPEELGELSMQFKDRRLKQLLPLYKARNFPSSLTDEERADWSKYLQKQLMDGGTESKLAQYFHKLEEAAAIEGLTKSQLSIIEDLDLYGQSLIQDNE